MHHSIIMQPSTSYNQRYDPNSRLNLLQPSQEPNHPIPLKKPSPQPFNDLARIIIKFTILGDRVSSAQLMNHRTSVNGRCRVKVGVCCPCSPGTWRLWGIQWEGNKRGTEYKPSGMIRCDSNDDSFLPIASDPRARARANCSRVAGRFRRIRRGVVVFSVFP